MPKFTIEDHEKRMRELLTPKPKELNARATLDKLLAKARERKLPKPPKALV